MTAVNDLQTSSVIYADGLVKRYGELVALDRTDIAVRPGSIVSLLGPSGCGKSTLLSMFAGLNKPSEGNLFYHGKPIRRPPDGIGVVFQRDLLLEWRTALDNVLLQFEMRGIDPKPHRTKALELLRRVGLEKHASDYPRQLSGGMRQRVAICRGLVHDPDLLLMDEPFSALDAITREKLAIDLENLTSEAHKTVVLVTHSLEEAVFLGDEVLVMSGRPGKIRARIKIDIPRPRRNWPRGETEFTPYILQAFDALQETGAFAYDDDV